MSSNLTTTFDNTNVGDILKLSGVAFKVIYIDSYTIELKPYYLPNSNSNFLLFLLAFKSSVGNQNFNLNKDTFEGLFNFHLLDNPETTYDELPVFLKWLVD